MSSRKVNPLRHTGKIIPLRTAGDIEAEVQRAVEKIQSGITEKPRIDDFADIIRIIQQRELSLVKSSADKQSYIDRTAVLAEAMALIELLKSRFSESPNPEWIAVVGIHVGRLIERASLRQSLEDSAYVGATKQAGSIEMAKKNAEERRKPVPDFETFAACHDKYKRQNAKAEFIKRKVMQELNCAKNVYEELLRKLKNS